MFGSGMSLVGTCAFGALARAGGGDLRGLVMALTSGSPRSRRPAGRCSRSASR